MPLRQVGGALKQYKEGNSLNGMLEVAEPPIRSRLARKAFPQGQKTQSLRGTVIRKDRG